MCDATHERSWTVAYRYALLLSLIAVSARAAFQKGPPIATRLSRLHENRNVSSCVVPDTDSKPCRLRQQRQQSVDRRPRHYWTDPDNLRNELCQFWQSRGVSIEENGNKIRVPTIPNEVLLMHYKRHDLRAAISKYGGREAVSKLLDDAPVMPGRWSLAVESSLALQRLLQLDTSLKREHPPAVVVSSADVSRIESGKKWVHNDGRKILGYWTLQTVVRELYETLRLACLSSSVVQNLTSNTMLRSQIRVC
jgi:hypothetical protein